LTAQGVQDLLKHEPDFEFIGFASTGQAALESLAANQPDVVVLDDNLPDMAATDLLAILHQQNWPGRVLLFSAEGNANKVRTLLEAGASGYLLKSGPAEELGVALRSVARGHRWFSQEIWALLAETSVGKEEEEEETGKLSKRQREILRRVAMGHTGAQIAVELGVTTKAINRQLERILARLDAPNRANAVYQATKKGWI
jgi:DNA-binding NarL/FixJ family response regulator